jgi:hypothetical protein
MGGGGSRPPEREEGSMLEAHGESNPEPMSARALLGWLYDMSFTRYYAQQVIKAVYWLVTILYSLVALVALVRLFQGGGPFRIVVGVVLIVVAYLLYLVIARIVLEVLIVIFRMGEDVRAIRTTGMSVAGPSAHQPGQPYFMPASAPAPPAASWPGPPDNWTNLGPWLEETVGYGDDPETPPTEATPAFEDPPSRPGGATNGERDYPPEADGPPWIA